ncbi:TonB-dependent receptor [Aggregatimonas sangjinii]|uniref:TonB-dependent receptor n=1 Tax=Aggregatimonas sangjinii TaxID=2583587 RepID=A0A5B7SN32_9FLAO|nr:TonB-dependent receptor [Aggregatimonas sangjinii]QCW99541.1 TonB-dependent receptor [Aggregatimonas sangjinii]
MLKNKILKRLNSLMFSAFVLAGALAYGQEKTISGTVVSSDDGMVIPGVNIVEKGTANGASTDFDGNYSINVSEGAVLIFSYIGFRTQEITVSSSNTINVTLEQDVSALDEVVVTGYGGVQRNEFVGATSVVKAAEIVQQPITTVEQGIRGRLAGVQVVQSSGAPGAGVSIRVRGLTSFAGGNEPLYVIDGIPLFNDDVRGLNGISSLNPNDIASIEVLKDASSTAIYGSRAANGVVQITTKGGTASDGIKVNYNAFASFQDVRKRFNLMTGDQFIAFATEYYNNSTELSEEERTTSLANLNAVGNVNTDWQDEVYRTGFHHSHNVSFTGGDNDNNYYVSANYMNQEGVIETTDFERIALRLNLQNKLSEKFRLNSRVSLSQSVNNGFLASDGTNTRNFGKSGIGSTLIAAPTVPVFDADGNFNSVAPYIFSDTDQENPAALLEALDRNRVNRAQAVLSLSYNITDNLTNVTRGSVDYVDRKSDFYSPRALSQLGSQVAQLETSQNLNTLIEDYLNYKNTFGKVGVDVLLGASGQFEERNSIFLAGTGFPSDALQNNAIQAAGTLAVPQTLTVDQSLVSFFGRVQLDYDKKYLISLNARRDGSSVFSENNQWANFAAIGGAWRISEEDFMKDGIFNNLKLRASTGSVGNQAIQPYQSLSLGSIILTGQGAGTGISVGLAPNLPNPNLTWETTVQTNFGIDAGIFNDKYRFSFDYYIKTTNDLLATVALPQSSGFTSIVDNVGKVENKGVELQIGADLFENEDWYFSVDAQYSRNKNEILETKDDQDIFSGGGNDASGSTAIVRPGESLFSFFAVKFLGLDDTGAPIYEDLDGNDVINGADRQVVGSPLPDFIYGFNTTLKYKKLTFLTNWQGVSGATVNNVALFRLTNPIPDANRVANLRDFYPTPRSDLFRIRSDRFIEDASYLRLANIRLGYDFDGAILGLDNINLYVSAQNILTITDYSGFDPEVNSFSGNDLRQGVDLAAYPASKTFTVGLNVRF